MAQLHGILSEMSGSIGQLTLKRLRGKTIVSEKISETTNVRSTAQQKHRMKWPNLIKNYSGISPLLNNAFENKTGQQSDYNLFVKTNFQGSEVYLTKQEAAANSCIAAPYQITMGSLDTIELSGEAGQSVTDIELGSLVIDDQTTVKEFAVAVVSENADFDFGDQLSFIRVLQETNSITGNPVCKFEGECVVLDKSSDEPLRQVVSALGFSVSEGKLACALDSSFQGAYAWVHSRKASGKTLVSTQVLTMKNDLYDQYSGDEAYQRAVESYGGENNSFLTPTETGTTQTVTCTLTLTASPSAGGTLTGAGKYTAGTSVQITATANSGFKFARWSDGATDASRTLTLTTDKTLLAVFQSQS